MRSGTWALLFLLRFLLASLAGMPGATGRAASPAPHPPARRSLLPPWIAPVPSSPLPPGVLEPDLARALAQARPEEELRVIVLLRQQPEPERAALSGVGCTEARVRLVNALQAMAERTQLPLRAYLEGARARGDVTSYTPFWIFNGLALRARPSVVRALAAHPDVALIRLDRYRRWLSSNQQPATGVAWNISRIRADQVWSSLGISGTGAVVAGMDTGVDWLHPALQANYRGYNPHGNANHVGNWFDAVNGSNYPMDDHGHGTHTMGTAVGQGGIGVAPGARWIGVKVINSGGYGYDSWIHAGFQWLLAPGGDPTKAPDVVNCSWGNDNGALTAFQDDLRALRAAGILPVFASGNNGPRSGTVGSPASLPEAFAVGAVDAYDEVTSFSSRGPSPWGEIRPHVVAPGVDVRSSLPGGLYAGWDGTSMAAPHVSGVVALLRSVSPTLSVTRAAFLITSTAVPLAAPVPNNDVGWGRVDGFAAVAALMQPGIVSGTVRRAGDGLPIAGATVEARSRADGPVGTATTDGSGSYLLALAPSIYDLSASAFGYEPATVWGVAVATGTTTVQNFSLTPLPTGTLRARVFDGASGNPITATLSVLDTPLEATASVYTFGLPSGTYVLQARRLGYRLVTATVIVTAGETTVADLSLPPAPSILLVDSGGWYYDSQVAYFRQALDDLAYVYDEWPIRHLPGDLPDSSDLTPYDVVVWTAPWDAPGYIGAGGVITGYLSGGGRLFLTGQDIGYLDGGGLGYASYYGEYLKVYLLRDSADVRTLEGVPGDLFAGMRITIAGPGGADDQEYPDVIGIADPDSAAPVLAYQEDGWGGARIGTCLDYRAVYLSFGFEGINDRAARREVMDRSLTWLTGEPPSAGLELTPAYQTRISLPGTTVTYAFRLRHVGQAGSNDRVHLSLTGARWPAELSQPELTLSPCTSVTLVVSVTIPATATWDVRDVVTLAARSSLSPALVQTAVLTTKAPAPVLLVDDDRWYEQQPVYRSAAEAIGVPYDVLELCPAVGGCDREEVSLEDLRPYPITVWWTGYDWFQPITAGEEAAMRAYLEGGGRLFLSSQDVLYHHGDDPFAREFLGVLTYTEGVTSTSVTGVPEGPIGAGLGPWELNFPFPRWSDGVEPTPGTDVVLRDQERRGVGLARWEGDHGTVFFPFPFEALPEVARPPMLERVVGWLSWLGRSTFSADRRVVSPGDVLTYTLRLRNDGPATVTASLSNTLPAVLTLLPGSIVGPAGYDPSARRVFWEGPLGPGVGVTVTYRVVVTTALSPGAAVTNPVRLGLEGQRIFFHRTAVVRVSTPDLSPSSFRFEPSAARPGAVVTGLLSLVNVGPADASAAVLLHPLPAGVRLVSDSLEWAGGGAAEVATDTICWAGLLDAGDRVTVTYRAILPHYPLHPPLYGVAFLEDGMGGRWERSGWVTLEPYRLRLPLIWRGAHRGG